jgi:hypothetical protein
MKLFFECADNRHFNVRDYGDGNRPLDEELIVARCNLCFAPLRVTSYQKNNLPNMAPILSWPPEDEDGVETC